MGLIELTVLLLMQVLSDALCMIQDAFPRSLAVIALASVLVVLTPVAYFLYACTGPRYEPRNPGTHEVRFQPLATDAARGRCPVCACSGPGSWAACPDCGTPHHVDCLTYVGGCAIYGCRARPFVMSWRLCT